MGESSFRLTAGTLLALLVVVASMALFAGELHQVKTEYGLVLEELREFRKEFTKFQVNQARLQALEEARNKERK